PGSVPAREAARSMIEARQRFFGKENVNPKTGAVRKDKVILSWFSVASYAASFNGHVVLLDGWIARGSHSGYVPTTPEEVAALAPEYIFIGHGDFDHAADVAEIAQLSGATVVGSPEHCDSVSEQAGEEIPCEAIVPEGATPGLVKKVNLIPGVDIDAVVHVHSSVERPQFDPDHLPCPPLWDAMDTAENPPDPEALRHLITHLPDARGANLLYQFRVGEFTLTHHDTVGKIDDYPLVRKALRALPQTDIDFGAVLAFGQVTNCLRSLGLYLRDLQPKVYAATHHDNFTYLIGANAEDLEPYVRAELDLLPKNIRPELLYTYDPDDYLNPEPFTFDPRDPRWR
ncbi:MAG: MBL fold metallo-hydrolase, partial [Actinomycetota bacterium]